MSFKIPNEADAANPNQAEPDSVDVDILVAALAGQGVVSGCAVTAQGSPDMSVAVAAGSVRINRALVLVTAGNVTVGTADGSNPRFDLITVNDSGTKACTAGTAAAEPVFPAIPSNSVVLAAVYVPASDTTIASNQITDKRAFVLRRFAKYDPDDPPATADAIDDEFEGGGSLDAKWTAVNNPAGGDAFNQTDLLGFLHMGLTENTGTDNLAARIQLYQTPPAGNQTLAFTTKFTITLDVDAWQTEKGEFAGGGIYLMDSANSQYVLVQFQYNNSNEANNLVLLVVTEHDAGAFTNQFAVQVPISSFVYLKLEKSTASAYTSSNTYNAYLSLNGITWHLVGTMSKTFTANCDRVGLMFRRPKSQNGAPAGDVLVDFFRRTD